MCVCVCECVLWASLRTHIVLLEREVVMCRTEELLVQWHIFSGHFLTAVWTGLHGLNYEDIIRGSI